ncbi:6-bladed beta-propeller [Algoriphagus sp. AGSA1]|uniref:6-bladed beta-propeller n=1 Tax=Algoriphagus sp. AGSA1 TaxID=2907213 RepID=UPI001F38B814|nr:6-bladed beta-propeller [Algoriphagus sp. AGSA1]MCE7055607.1 6-bladed beta-propeller [Algoriphagus sp. AGSA1]
MTRINIWFILSLFISFGCSKAPSHFSYQPIMSEEPLLVSEIGKELDIIEIQTRYPITGTPTILKSDRYFYLFEQGVVTTLHQIGLNGKVVKSIDFGFDDKLNADAITQVVLKQDHIGIISRGNSIVFFDENLEEVSTEKLPFKAHFHFNLNEQTTISYNNRIDDLEDYDILIDRNGVLSKELPIRKDEYNFVYKSYAPFSNWNEQVLFSQAFNDTIYVLDEKGFKPLVIVDFGADAVNKERFLQIQHAMDMLTFFNERNYSYLMGEVYGLGNERVLFQVSDKGRQKLGLIDFQSNELTIYPGIFDNSISAMALHNPQFSKDGELFFGISGERIMENYDRLPDPFKHQLSDSYAESFFIFELTIKN